MKTALEAWRERCWQCIEQEGAPLKKPWWTTSIDHIVFERGMCVALDVSANAKNAREALHLIRACYLKRHLDGSSVIGTRIALQWLREEIAKAWNEH